MTDARQIGIAMFAYAQDYQGQYPRGKSSTEVFQKLIDGKYLTDPTIFCTQSNLVPGKFKATSSILKPENVCWDITVPLDDKSPDDLPLIFLTGYRIDYVTNGSAIPLHSDSKRIYDGLAVCYLAMTASWKVSQPDGTVTNFISPNFQSDGKKYVQLTPDGPLP